MDEFTISDFLQAVSGWYQSLIFPEICAKACSRLDLEMKGRTSSSPTTVRLHIPSEETEDGKASNKISGRSAGMRSTV